MITNLKNLSKEIANERIGKQIVLATGTFDLFHYEHLKYLEGAKSQGDILVVAVKNNKCAGLKGNERPIIDEQQRIAIVDAIKYVDYSFLVDYDPNVLLEIEADNENQKEWLIMFQETFKTLKPDILYYEDNPKLQTARDKVFNRYGISGIMKPRGQGASTTEIIKKISNS
jgi:cytidyltransferase-like protein